MFENLQTNYIFPIFFIIATILAIVFAATSLMTFKQYTSMCFRFTIIAAILYFLHRSLKGEPSGIIILLALLFLYFYTYFSSRTYLENFADTTVAKDDCRPIEQKLTTEYKDIAAPLAPYATEPIESTDDYEYNMVFENENDREISKELRRKLMSQHPMDWTVQPPSSIVFQQGLKEHFQDASGSDNSGTTFSTDNSGTTFSTDNSGANVSGANGSIGAMGNQPNIYANVSGANVAPPNMDSVEEKERKVLKTYVPKHANDLKTYNVDDAYTLIKNMYDAKGLVATVDHAKDTNIYTITGTRKVNEPVTYEDEGVASNEPVAASGEGTIKVPQAATDMLKDSDPFYNEQNKSRMGKHDYTKYTPGLERAFSPSYPLSQWY